MKYREDNQHSRYLRWVCSQQCSETQPNQTTQNTVKHLFQPGQKLRVTNPDFNILEEEWTVVEVIYPIIKFSCWRRWHIDKEYILPTSTEPYSGKVVQEDSGGVVVIDARHIWQETGYRIEGNRVTCLSKSSFQWYLNQANTA